MFKVNRFEVISHLPTREEESIGRVLSIRGDMLVECELQDDNRTLKIFLSKD